MKTAIVPVSCGVVLAAISAAGLSHWFSVREMVIAYQIRTPGSVMAMKSEPKPAVPVAAPVKAEAKPAAAVTAKPAPVRPAPASQSPAVTPSSEEFFRSLVQEFKTLKDENRNLLEQLEETNRDVMNMQFRLDTHSAEFRPLPSSTELRSLDAVLDSGQVDNGVLPPLDPSLPLPER